MGLNEGEDGGDSGYRIAHVSDIHFGKIAHPAIVESLVADVNNAHVDLVVVSGDLTQRAFPHQYQAAADMLSAFDSPWIAVPGNHDVFPWWRTFSRLFDPLRRYREYITEDLSPGYRLPGMAVLGINSAFGRTVKGGHIAESQREAMRTFFSESLEGDFRILAVHHHLTTLKAMGAHDVAREARATLDTAAELEIDLILCGHLHISHVDHVQVISRDHPIVIASAGTATSSRGRKEHRKTNFYNQILISPGEYTIEERRFDTDTLTFNATRVKQFERTGRIRSDQ